MVFSFNNKIRYLLQNAIKKYYIQGFYWTLIITSSPFVASETDVAATVVKLDFSLILFTVSNI